ncbi:MAG: MOSC domain-containing protein [Bacteroidetes bacterium]|nr:MOSC domain-containing protein [Fibrella sp.]
MQTIRDLFNVFPRPGRIEWIGIRPAKRAPVQAVQAVTVLPNKGLAGEHYGGTSGTRDVTLIQAEHLPVVAALVGRDAIDPAELRRNLVVSGLNLLALKDHQVQIGEHAEAVVLQVTGPCHPCSKMETALGPGGYNAVRGHGGLTARVIRGGTIRVGDAVRVLPEQERVIDGH